MKYLPGAIAAANLDTVNAPYLGGEWAVYMTQVQAILLGEIDLSAAGVGTWTPHNGAAMTAAGGDLQITPITPIASSAALQVTLTGLDTTTPTASAVTATATFAPPARSANQTFNFPRGYALDLTLNPSVLMATQRSRTTNVATITVPNHDYTTGQAVTTTLFGGTGYNLTDVTITVVDANHISFASTGANEAVTADTTGTITPVGVTTLFSAINAVQTPTIVNGGTNQKLRVYQLPNTTDWVLIEPTTEVDFNTKSRAAKGINSGLEADAYVKAGMSNAGDLTINGNFKSLSEGMARFDGQKCTCMLVGVKDGVATEDRIVFVNYRPVVKPKLPVGDGEVMADATGKYVDQLFFVAP
jgi:hypothetical protein